ncbi:sodium-dependent glucose transporter 1-like protein [Dinothrombium tinctorium]|uniref:Sodium-dependent glucose transporter 1-like protein n=1 Tax=Dinothrombium tinctorium TaxID=1965070 RepID=A0A3S3P4U4_9ACAR|nr:sodium-dependent glucose transporter 1-like protein [Dinothrombium tinctorium]
MSGFVPKQCNKEAQLVIAILAQAIFLSAIPYIRIFWVFYMTAAFVGFILGFVETGVKIYIAFLWSDAAKIFLQLGATFYGLGLSSAPIIAEPFLSEAIDVHNLNETKGKIENDYSSVKWPYEIIAIFMLIVAVAFGFISYLSHDNLEANVDHQHLEIEEKASVESSRLKYMITFLIILLFHLCAFPIMTFRSFLTTFAVKSNLRLSKSKGAFITIAYAIAYSAAKIPFLVLMGFMKTKTLIIIELCIGFIASVILLLFGAQYELALWIGIV